MKMKRRLPEYINSEDARWLLSPFTNKARHVRFYDQHNNSILTYHVPVERINRYLDHECIILQWNATEYVTGCPKELNIKSRDIEGMFVRIPLRPGQTFLRGNLTEMPAHAEKYKI